MGGLGGIGARVVFGFLGGWMVEDLMYQISRFRELEDENDALDIVWTEFNLQKAIEIYDADKQ